MKNILNYGTASEMLTAGNVVPAHDYWLARTNYYKKTYIPSKIGPQPEMTVGPFRFKGMVSSPVPGVAYLEESGTTFYNNTKFPYINLDEKLGGRQSAQFTWAELGITEDIYQAYKDEVNNFNPLCVLNIVFQGNYCNEIFTLHEDSIDFYLNSGAYILNVYANGTAEFHENAQ